MILQTHYGIFAFASQPKGTRNIKLDTQTCTYKRTNSQALSLYARAEAASHVVNQEGCASHDSLFSTHQHRTSLETTQPFSTVQYPSHGRALHLG